MYHPPHDHPEPDTHKKGSEVHKIPAETDPTMSGEAKQDTQSDSAEEALEEFPPIKTVVAIMSTILLCVFFVGLDRTIIASAIPRMTDEFNSLEDVGWYGSAYMLTSCSFQLLCGRLYTLYRAKSVYLGSIILFEIGSMLCATSPTSLFFIIGRAVAGIGSAGITTGSVVLLVGTVPLEKRPLYMALIGASFGISSIVGPLIGGAFTSAVTWRWCFYINLPIGAISFVVILWALAPVEPTCRGMSFLTKMIRLDFAGQIFLMPSVICLLLAFEWAGTRYSWSDARIIALLTLFSTLWVGFVLVQCYMQDVAMIPKSAIGNRSVISGIWFTFCLSASMTILAYYIAIWFQAVRGVSAIRSGINTIPMVAGTFAGGIFAARMTARLGYYTPLMVASAAFTSIGAGFTITWTVNTSVLVWAAWQVLFGFGAGMGMQQGAMAAQTVLDKTDVATGVSLMAFAQQLGGAIFVSVGQNIMVSSLAAGITGLVPGSDSLNIVSGGATDLKSAIPPQYSQQVLETYNGALRSTFIAATVMAACSMLGAVAMEWRSIKEKGPSKQASE